MVKNAENNPPRADMNNFYASVECLYHPEIRDKPVVVGGDPEARHGIVLAKNYVAKNSASPRARCTGKPDRNVLA